MEYLFSRRDKIIKRLSRRYVSLFLDYDGTLTPIAQTPDKAALSKERKDLLDKLSKNLNCRVVIISGRSLEDIKQLIGIKGIVYVGNHGLEIEGPEVKSESRVSERLKLIIRNVYKEIASRLSSIKGVLVEDKGLTLSVHYRLVSSGDIQKVARILTEIIAPYVVRNKIKVNSGKRVYEISPRVMWDKGKAVSWLLARQQLLWGKNRILPVYIGDDITDEDAFKVLKNKGLTVFIGKKCCSQAQYYLRNTKEVTEFLRIISDLIANKI